MARAKFKLSMLTPAERKAHNSRVTKINKLVAQGRKVQERALKRAK